jgi:hypothetical protein
VPVTTSSALQMVGVSNALRWSSSSWPSDTTVVLPRLLCEPPWSAAPLR